MKFHRTFRSLCDRLNTVINNKSAPKSVVTLFNLIKSQLEIYLKSYPDVSQSEVVVFISKLEKIKISSSLLGKKTITTLGDIIGGKGLWTLKEEHGTLSDDVILANINDKTLSMLLDVHRYCGEALRYLRNENDEILTQAIGEWRAIHLQKKPNLKDVFIDYQRSVELQGYKLINAEPEVISAALEEFVDKTIAQNPSMAPFRDSLLDYFFHYSGQSVSRLLDYELFDVINLPEYEHLISHAGPIKMAFDGRATRWSQKWSSENGRFYCDLDVSSASLIIASLPSPRVLLDPQTQKIETTSDLHKYTLEERLKLLQHPIVDAYVRLTLEPDPDTGWLNIRVLEIDVDIHATNMTLNLNPSDSFAAKIGSKSENLKPSNKL